MTFNFRNGGDMTIHNHVSEPWEVTIVDTGLDTMTGGRIKRIRPYTLNESFMMTYGDGVCDVNMKELLRFHKEAGKIVTLTSVYSGQKFGVLDIDNDSDIISFREKQHADGARINGGYMVLEPEIFEYLEGDSTIFEQGPLEKLAGEKKVKAYQHDGFWQCMDTLRDKERLETLWASGNAPWKVWI